MRNISTADILSTGDMRLISKFHRNEFYNKKYKQHWNEILKVKNCQIAMALQWHSDFKRNINWALQRWLAIATRNFMVMTYGNPNGMIYIYILFISFRVYFFTGNTDKMLLLRCEGIKILTRRVVCFSKTKTYKVFFKILDVFRAPVKM